MTILSDFLSLFYPRICMACGNTLFKNEEVLCTFCLFHLPKTNFHLEKDNPVSMQEAVDCKPQIAIFSAGAGTSKEWAPRFSEAGATVIDNSSAWRMFDEIPLVVPEINASVLSRKDKIIANPNCSTIEMVLALAPLHKKYKIRRVVVSTYQSVTGTGVKAVKQLNNERNGISGDMAYPYPIDLNVLPHEWRWFIRNIGDMIFSR